jgi:alpha-D-xyloside xylohydrolase
MFKHALLATGFGTVLADPGARFTIGDKNLVVQLTPFADNSVRVQIAPPGNTIQDPPLSALYLEQPPLTRTAGALITNGFSNGNLAVTVDPATGFVTATRLSDNAVLISQTGISFAGPTSPGTRNGSVSASISFTSVAGERVYGLGEHRTGTVEMLGPAGNYFKLFQDSQYYPDSHGGDVSIPWYMSNQGYGFVWNSPSYGYLNATRGQGITWMSNATMNVDFWITTTPVPAGDSSPSMWASLMSHYIDAVGHAPPMPFYSTGFIQCKDRYRNQSQILSVAQGYVDRDLPISVIVQE